VAVQAGLATLDKLRRPGVYEQLEQSGARVQSAFEDAARRHKVPLVVQRVGSMLTPFFSAGPVRSWTDAARCDTAAFGRFHQALIANRVYWPPSQFEAGFISTTHDEATFQLLERAVDSAFKSV
jgi:glutamate-1-semialdehyde 2,1-aminomutase